jgi:hypothetical protein
MTTATKELVTFHCKVNGCTTKAMHRVRVGDDGYGIFCEPHADEMVVRLNARARICDECDYPIDSKPHLDHCPEALRG